jgi:hypothetical protein
MSERLIAIAQRYKNCEVNIYPDLPEMTPVEGVIRCAHQEGFILAHEKTLTELRGLLEQSISGFVDGGQYILTYSDILERLNEAVEEK